MTGDPPGSGVEVSRATIIEAARAGPARVVGVTAAAGYGKSGLLAQWARTDHRVVATVALDRSCDDVNQLLRTLGTAFFDAVRAPDTVRAVAAPGAWVVTAHRLAAAMTSCRRPFVLLVDDTQVLRSSSCHEVLRMLVSAIPSGSQIVTASRHSQPHLARMRAGRGATELTRDELAFDRSQAIALFARRGVALTPDEADRVVDATEGWPVGIGLAALRSSEGAPPSALMGDDRVVADYFEAEVLAPLSQEARDFLRWSAVLDRLSGELCDAVLGRRDSAARLRELESTTLFVMPVGPGRHWYRHHRLFRQFLLGDLQREDTAVVRELHGRAADWYVSAGSPQPAIEHLLATDERRRTAELVASEAPIAWQAGQVATVERWLARLGDARIAEHPGLSYVQGWVAVLTGRPEVAERWLGHLGVHSDGAEAVTPELAMLRSAMCPVDPALALEDARHAVTALDRWSPRRAAALALCGEAHLMLGETDEAVEWLGRACRAAEQDHRPDVVMSSRATLAWLAMDRGAWDAGAEDVRSSLAALAAVLPGPGPATLLAHAASARAHLHRGDLQAASRALADALAARLVSTYARPFPAVKGRVGAAKLLWATGDHAGARALLREVHDIFLERPDLGVLRAELDGFVEMIQGGTATEHDSIASPLTPAELRVLPYLPTHLTIAQIGERLFVSRNTVNSEIASIYRKLGVSTRDHAVNRATVLGLLGR
ncbi:LuxR C-terminal-related transcriptional regulator [Aeromicrobium sp.]|uniref:LuxR C-terminal-related transcriptional regulator n=1 Tax=Aeromicrobium sp. TaxID=1871063 RepID=UPI0028AE5DEE|nr:LuxR C-terminal-related transcriptional regulator [Aeromicrobium sp.]